MSYWLECLIAHSEGAIGIPGCRSSAMKIAWSAVGCV